MMVKVTVSETEHKKRTAKHSPFFIDVLWFTNRPSTVGF